MNDRRQRRGSVEIPDRSSRTVFAMGRSGGDDDFVAYRCRWCDGWISDDDQRRAMEGAKVSHGICEECEAHHFGDPL